MLNVLLVDDNYEYLEFMFNELSDQINKKLKIVKICSDGEKALDYIMNTKIDIILLDLNIPKVNGIEILEKMKENNIDSQVIVISGETDFIVEIISKKLSVSQILVKPFELEDLINSLDKIIFDLDENEKIDSDVNEKILKLLNEFCFNKNNIGYKYIVDSLNFCVDRECRYINRTKKLYKDIAKQYDGITSTNIEWNISKCIQSMNKLTHRDVLEKYFPYNNYPSPKMFLNEILDTYYAS